jgi:two-component system, repressor protein LuxO
MPSTLQAGARPLVRTIGWTGKDGRIVPTEWLFVKETGGKHDILVVEDTPSMARLYTEYVRRLDAECRIAGTASAALLEIDARVPDALLLDLHLPDGSGMDILREVRQRGLPCPAVVMTANGSIGAAVDAMRSGAYDFLVKPFSADRLAVTLRNALHHELLTRRVSALEIDSTGRFQNFIGASPMMKEVYRSIEKAARSKATVFITGESGTGKELCAEAIKALGPRRNAPLVTLNCGAIPAELMESEIFGHVRGAFTGAVSDREGAVSRANGGTFFLDEVCELDLALQVKLLRVLQTGSFQRVGGTRTETADVRYICATNRDPAAEVEAGRFREDLFYRLHVVPISLPPLRERGDDCLLIADDLLRRFGIEEGKAFTGFEEDVRWALKRYPWPGNVRQLQNLIRRIIVMHDGPWITGAMLPPEIAGLPAVPGKRGEVASQGGGIVPLWQIERQAIEQAIAICGGNIPRAAAMLEVSPSTIYRKKLGWTD